MHPRCDGPPHLAATLATAAIFFRASGFRSFSLNSKTNCVTPRASAVRMEGSEITEEVTAAKKVFVAGATGSTGKRIVEQLLAKGFAVKAGVRDIEKAKSTFPGNNPNLQI